MERAYSQSACEMLGLKLVQASKLDDTAAIDQLKQVSKELREALITCGVKKRRAATPWSEERKAAAAKKRGKKGK